MVSKEVMVSGTNLQLLSLFKFLSQVASIVVIFFGILVLSSIGASSAHATYINLIPFKAVTALAFITCGGLLWILRQEKLDKIASIIARACTLVVVLLGLVTLVGYFFKFDLFGDQLFFKSGRINLNVALNFLILGVALFLIDIESKNGYRPTELLSLVAIFISMIGFIGYAYGASSLFYLQMDPHISITFAVLSLGILFSRPDKGIMSLVTSNYAGGFMIRRLLVTLIGASFLLGSLRLVGQQTGLFGNQFGILLVIIINTIVVGALIVKATRFLDSLDVRRRHVEEEVQKLNKELEQRVVERTMQLDKANKSLRVAMKALEHRAEELAKSSKEAEQFAYIASHDLQQPLDVIGGYVKLLARRYKGKLDKDADDFITYVVDGVSRMQKLITDLLRYSRLGAQAKILKPTDCSTIIEQVIKNLKTKIEESKATVTKNSLPVIMVDSSQLSQVFQNLIGNALKFCSKELPKVYISAEKNGSEWIFSVSDNGIGIDPVYADRIFVMFERLHSEAEYPGSGIGLSICKKIIDSYGGRIWVESEPAKGAKFYFTIPIIE